MVIWPKRDLISLPLSQFKGLSFLENNYRPSLLITGDFHQVTAAARDSKWRRRNSKGSLGVSLLFKVRRISGVSSTNRIIGHLTLHPVHSTYDRLITSSSSAGGGIGRTSEQQQRQSFTSSYFISDRLQALTRIRVTRMEEQALIHFSVSFYWPFN